MEYEEMNCRHYEDQEKSNKLAQTNNIKFECNKIAIEIQFPLFSVMTVKLLMTQKKAEVLKT